MISKHDDARTLAASVRDPARFGSIYERHGKHVLRYLRRRLGDEIAEDAAAEVFVRAFRLRGEYVRRHDSALPWLYWIAGYVVADHRRAAQRRLDLLVRLVATATSDFVEDADPNGTCVDDGVVRALRQINATDRETLLLIVWGELSYQEAAIATGVPIGTVRSRVARARAALQEKIAVIDPDTDEEERQVGAHV